MALRVTSAYRTVSYEAVTLIARIPPFHLLVAKMSKIYIRKQQLKLRGDVSVDNVKKIYESAEILMRRQWLSVFRNRTLPGRYTCKILLPEFQKWLDRTHGNVNYFITQILTEHGCFAAYLHRIGKVLTTDCSFCDDNNDTAEHTLFHCPAWERIRWKFYIDLELGDNPTWKEILAKMLLNAENWKAVFHFVKEILQAKAKKEVT